MEFFSLITFLLSIGGALCTLVLPILFIAGIGYFIYRRSKMKDAAKLEAQSWSSTMGVVISSTIQVRYTSRSRSEIPIVVYQYQVDGKSFQGQTIKAGEQFLNIRLYGDAQKTVDRYPVGAQVMVYFDPENPAQSALER